MRAAIEGVVILGAGLTGAGIALELAGRGIDVTLLDQDERAMNRASLRNEGKIHLGLIYANDPSRATALRQLDGALRFRAITSRWLGGDGALRYSTPFHYLVARDSVLPAGELATHYAALEARAREYWAADAGRDYLGSRPERLFRALEPAEIGAHFSRAHFPAGFATAERALETDAFAEGVRAALARESRIRFAPRHRVDAVERDGRAFRVRGHAPTGPFELRAAQVANASWERRVALDAGVGLPAPPDLLHRLKYRVIARLPAALRSAPSATIVLGRYGDVVIRPDGFAYLSWYPAGLRGWANAPEPPRAWDAACRGEQPEALSREIGDAIRAAIGERMPGMAGAEIVRVDAGAIVAVGRSDVDDRASGLHDRSHIGVFSDGGFHSVEPGKLTTAPVFAVEAADRIEAGLRGGVSRE